MSRDVGVEAQRRGCRLCPEPVSSIACIIPCVSAFVGRREAADRFFLSRFRPSLTSPPPGVIRAASRLELKSYRIVEGTPDVDLGVIGKRKIGEMEVEVIDPTEVTWWCIGCSCAIPTVDWTWRACRTRHTDFRIFPRSEGLPVIRVPSFLPPWFVGPFSCKIRTKRLIPRETWINSL